MLVALVISNDPKFPIIKVTLPHFIQRFTAVTSIFALTVILVKLIWMGAWRMRIHSTMWINLPLLPGFLLSLTGSKNKSKSNQVTAERLLLYSYAATLLLFLLNMSCALFGPARNLEILKELNKALFMEEKGNHNTVNREQNTLLKPSSTPSSLLSSSSCCSCQSLASLSSTGTHGGLPPPPHLPLILLPALMHQLVSLPCFHRAVRPTLTGPTPDRPHPGAPCPSL